VSAVLIGATTLGSMIERIGAYGGLASVIGLGVLALLYFAQAREVKRLREWAGRAPERAAEVEQRVLGDVQRRVVAEPQTPAAQVAATPAGTSPPARLPTAGLSGDAATRAAGAAIVAARASHPPPPVPGPPGQLARPSVAATATPGGAAPATPGGQVPGASAPAPGAVAPASSPWPAPVTAPGLGNPAPAPVPTKPSPPDAGEAPATSPSSAALGVNRPSATVAATASSPESAAPAPPRVVAQPAGVTNGAGQETRESAAARPLPPRVPPLRPPVVAPPADDGKGRSPGRLFAIIGGVLGLGLIAGLVVMFVSGGDEPATKTPSTLGAVPESDSDSESAAVSAPVIPADTTTSVLNGTTQAGLASGVAAKLDKAGFRKGEVGDNVDQTLAETVVYFTDGNERAARRVARILGVSANAVKPGDRDIAVATPDADVVVMVGADLIE